MSIWKRIVKRLMYVYRVFIARDSYLIACRAWIKKRGDTTLRLDYRLSANSIVFDLGGYEGSWATEIVRKFDAHVYVFEPIPEYYNNIRDKLAENSKVRVFNFGLSAKTGVFKLGMLGDGSSLHRQGDSQIDVDIKDIAEFISEYGITAIDLIKINIEGEEFPLLERMIETGIVGQCRDIQVQFHSFYPDADIERARIRARLEDTHYLTYDFPFIWENWRRSDHVYSP